jgi:hypothetical protein
MRILLCGISNLLVTIISGALAPFPDLIVAGRVDRQEELGAQIRSTQADGVIMAAADPDQSADFEALLRNFPMLKVVAIRIDGSKGCLHELRVYSLPLAELSAEVLNAAFHAAPLPS